MTSLKVARSDWYPDKRLIITQLSGEVDKADIEQWEQSLEDSLSEVEDQTTFRIFVNMVGFKAIDIDAHKRFRGVIPLTLAEYGWKVGYVDLFEEEAKSMNYTNTRGIRCVAAAHAHHDASKIEKYETHFSRNEEHFFTDPVQAEQWIVNYKIANQV